MSKEHIEISRVMSTAIGKLVEKLVDAQDRLRKAESCQGKGWDPRRCNRIREEIIRIERRLTLAEHIQDAALSKSKDAE